MNMDDTFLVGNQQQQQAEQIFVDLNKDSSHKMIDLTNYPVQRRET